MEGRMAETNDELRVRVARALGWTHVLPRSLTGVPPGEISRLENYRPLSNWPGDWNAAMGLFEPYPHLSLSVERDSVGGVPLWDALVRHGGVDFEQSLWRESGPLVVCEVFLQCDKRGWLPVKEVG
jgi:hypothetical protein